MTVKCNPTFDSALLATWPIGSQRRFIYLAYDCKTVDKKEQLDEVMTTNEALIFVFRRFYVLPLENKH